MPNWITQPTPYDDTKSLAENKRRDRGTLKCSCGYAVNLGFAMWPPDYAASCDGCGSLYNLSGQALRPKNEWEEDIYGDD